MLLIYLSCAWITGILLGSKFSLYPVWLDLALIPLPLLFFFWHRKKLIISVSLLILALLGGIVRYQSSLPTESDNVVQFYNDKAPVEMMGMVSQAPDVRDKSTHIYLAHIEIKTADKPCLSLRRRTHAVRSLGVVKHTPRALRRATRALWYS